MGVIEGAGLGWHSGLRGVAPLSYGRGLVSTGCYRTRAIVYKSLKIKIIAIFVKEFLTVWRFEIAGSGAGMMLHGLAVR